MVTRVRVCVSLLLYLINDSLVDGTTNNSNASGVKFVTNYYVAIGQANFFQAYINCKNGGMDLVSVNSKEDKENLDNFLSDKPDNYWLGGTNAPNVGSNQYYWLAEGRRAIFTDWLPGFPNASSEASCIQWGISSAHGWHNGDCQAIRSYLCQDNPYTSKNN